MSVLGWGKPLIEYLRLGDDSATWTAIDIPKEGTTALTSNDGTSTEAKEEGGGLVDFKMSANTSALSFSLFLKKGMARPFDDNDGVIDGLFSVRLSPEDKECTGFIIKKCTLRCTTTYSSEEGTLLTYTANALKPDDDEDGNGNMVQPYIKGVVSPSQAVAFFNGNGTPSVTINVSSRYPLLSATSDAEWVHASIAGDTVSVYLDANMGGQRHARILVKNEDNGSVYIDVYQAKKQNAPEPPSEDNNIVTNDGALLITNDDDFIVYN